MVIRAAWVVAVSLGLASPARAGDCRLALVVALDVSSSVDAQEYRLQQLGMARALVAPEVKRAFLMGDPVALYIFEWSSPFNQDPLLPDWQLIRSEKDLAAVADALAAHPRSDDFDPYSSTALGTALSFAANVLQDGPDCRAHTIDVSGDGVNNHYFDPAYAYAYYPFDGVTVNALVIGGAMRSNLLVSADDLQAELVSWFEAEVLHGPGAFYILASGYSDYERAMTVKLLRELEMPLVSGWPLAAAGG